MVIEINPTQNFCAAIPKHLIGLLNVIGLAKNGQTNHQSRKHSSRKIRHIYWKTFDMGWLRQATHPWSHIKDRNTLAKFQCDTREEAVEKFREYIENGAGMHLLAKLPMLKGKTLGCFCNVDKGEKCHGEVLIELIKKYCV